MNSRIWQVIFFVAICGIKQAISECKAITGERCLTRDDPGASGFFDFFGWKSTCFDHGGLNWCMVGLGKLKPCKCKGGSGGGSGGTGGGGSGDKLKCDSSSVKDFKGCKELKKVFCPLVMKNDEVTYQNTLCKYCGEDKQSCKSKICSYDITSEEDKQRIVDKHNKLRSKVAYGNEKRGVGGPQPQASNMNRLTWDDNLAKSAQMWALQCQQGHDKNRQTPQFKFWVGQNIASSWSSVKSSKRQYEQMIQGWYDEVKDFPPANIKKYSSEGATGVVGHYTALVWAATTRVGCGFVMYYDDTQPSFPYKKMLVCNYGHGGNILGQKMYEIGKPGSECPNGHKDGLCN